MIKSWGPKAKYPQLQHCWQGKNQITKRPEQYKSGIPESNHLRKASSFLRLRPPLLIEALSVLQNNLCQSLYALVYALSWML